MQRHDPRANCLCVLVIATIVSLLSPLAWAQTPSGGESVPNMADGFPLVFWNRQITVFRSYYDQFSPAERATRAAERLAALPEESEWQVVANETTSGQYSGAIISANGHFAFAILTTDLDSEAKESLTSATDHATMELRLALEARSQQGRVSVLLRGIGLSIGATLLLLLGLWFVIRGGNRILSGLEKSTKVTSERWKLGGFDLRPLLQAVNGGLAKLIIWGAAVTLIYIWLTFILLRFPYTEPWGQHLGTFLISLISMLGTGLLSSIPGVFTVALIFLLARLVTRVVNGLFTEVEQGNIKCPGLHRDTARASRHLVMILIWMFALTVAYPYIPGSSTDAFKGVSVFVGLMISLGSAGFVNQVMSGLVVVYSRALRPGEVVRIGDDLGTVTDVGMLSTKIVTHRREEITIPSGVLVGTRTVNYSRRAAGAGTVLGTTVTIGYDAPWRLVHEMLLRAADQTPGVRKDPSPRVHQKALSDFYVEYELEFNVDDPARRVPILSEVHMHIQDAFNDEGVQIMSPHYESQPNERVVVPRTQWFPKSFQASSGQAR
jgi:small-conductance mechanosensitive channel